MMNYLKAGGIAAALSVAAPLAASASIVSQIDIAGVVNTKTSDFAAGDVGDVDVDLSATGIVLIATGVFSSLNVGDVASLTSIDFDAPGTIWSIGGFSFVADSFTSISSTLGDVDFTAVGNVVGTDYDQAGTLTFSSQDRETNVSFSSTTVSVTPMPVPAAGFLLLAGLGALGIAGRKKKAS